MSSKCLLHLLICQIKVIKVNIYIKRENYLKRLELEKKKLDRTKLAGYDIKLSLLDDIDENIGRASYLTEEIVDAMDKASEARMLAADIIRFDFRDALYFADDELDRLEKGIEDLGIDVPAEVEEMKRRVQELKDEEKIFELRMKEDFNFNVG